MGLSLAGWLPLLLTLQVTGATVAGIVRDGETNEPLPDLIVVLTDLGRAARTDSAGHYVFQQVSPGPHHLAVRYLGYAPRTLRALVPQRGLLQIDVSLTPVETRLAALVVRRSVIARSDDVPGRTKARFMSIGTVRNDPRFMEADVLHALSGGDVVARPESPSGLHVQGGASDHVAYLVDGIPVFSPYHSAGLFSTWNPQAIGAVSLASPSPGDPAALAGVVTATTRAPAHRLQAQSSLSTTHVALTVDGPLGVGDAGFLVSARSGYPHLTAPSDDASPIRGGSRDFMAKVEIPVRGGRLSVLGVGSEDHVNTSRTVDSMPTPAGGAGNAFEWGSHSVGVEWRRSRAGVEVGAVGWHAAGDAGSAWDASRGVVTMTSRRRDAGFRLSARRDGPRSSSMVGARVERSVTDYRVDFLAGPDSSLQIASRALVGVLFLDHAAALAGPMSMRAGGALTLRGNRVYGSPQAALRWNARPDLSVTGSYARSYQFTQSLRNEESVAGNVFPADLAVGAGTAGIPVARSDQGVLAVAYRPSSSVRVAARAYERRFGGSVLVAPFEGEPFATGTFGVGDGESRGVSIETSWSAARFGLVASYALQHVRYSTASSSYTPYHGATHLLDGGVIVFPTPTFSLRLGVAAAAGRRGTDVAGAFEWEACNLRDRGCEFGGSPRTAGMRLGGTSLPWYARLDLGARKDWHRQVHGRETMVALFGAATNVSARTNVLSYARADGGRTPIEMRPFAPLVIGLEWRF
jgi:hypothetical protein